MALQPSWSFWLAVMSASLLFSQAQAYAVDSFVNFEVGDVESQSITLDDSAFLPTTLRGTTFSARDTDIRLAVNCNDGLSLTTAQQIQCLRGNGTKGALPKRPKPSVPERSSSVRTKPANTGTPSSNQSATRKKPRPTQGHRDVKLASKKTQEIREYVSWLTDTGSSLNVSIRFNKNSASLRADGKSQLQDRCEVFREFTNVGRKIIFVGHADTSGSAVHNLNLSLNRARTATSFVSSRCDIQPNLLDSFGAGEEMPLSEHPSNSRFQRRVQFSVLPLPSG